MSVSVSSFGVIGAGMMGRGIAEVAAVKGGFDRVVLVDAVQSQLDDAIEAVEANIDYLVGKSKLEAAQKDAALECLETSPEIPSAATCGFVIEAVPEDIDIKRRVLSALGQAASEETIIATNTSSLPITRLASFTGRPERFIGMHFMNPVPRMKGVEIISGLRTSPGTRSVTLDLAGRFGKEITFSRDKAGFVVNRILIPMLNDAVSLVESGPVAVEQMDAFFTRDKNGPRHRMGPLMLSDLIGLDTVQHILRVLEGELGSVYAPTGLLDRMVGERALGLKSGGGFYIWDGGRPRGVNKAIAGLSGRGNAAGVDTSLARRPWLVMVNEALRIIEEGTSSISDVDRGCVFCLNHPEGVFAALDRFGIQEALSETSAVEERFGAAWKPAPLLRRLAEAGLRGAEDGVGVYEWKDDGRGSVNPALAEYLKA